MAGASEIQAVQRAVKEIYIDPLIKQYIVGLVDATRQHESVYLGASPRGSLALYRTCQARALLDGRDFVLPDDVKELAYACLGHRIIVSPSARVKAVTAARWSIAASSGCPCPGYAPEAVTALASQVWVQSKVVAHPLRDPSLSSG